jgi:ubiquinone/menaquinone biosynthesis C-methylase UbiE
MLELAKARNKEIEWKYGAAEDIPGEDNSFDGAICNLTIHHWKDIPGGFKELYRVLKPGGRIAIFTSLPEQMKGYWLCHYFPEMMRLSALQMPDMGIITTAAKEAELEIEQTEAYSVKEDLQDHFLYIGKHDPEQYFNETTRKGISSFSSVSNLEEVNAGLARLRADIKSGDWMEVRNHYENNMGDYLFVVLRKP